MVIHLVLSLHVFDMQKKLYPNLVHDAQLIIKELENVTVLWEELWLGTLQDLHPGEFLSLSLSLSPMLLLWLDTWFGRVIRCSYL